MSIIYKRLFNLKIGHDYYKNGLAKGVVVRPTPSTQTLLANGKLIFKAIPGGAVVLYRTWEDEITPVVDLGKDVKFTFYLKPENPVEFFNITDLDESASRKFQSSNILHFVNDPANASADPINPETISHRLVDMLTHQIFNYEFTLSSGPATVLLRVHDENGNLVSIGKGADGTPFPTTVTVAKSADGIYRQQIDLRAYASGKFNIVIRDTADTGTLKEAIVYADSSLASQPVLGIIDIVYETGTDHIYADIEEYHVSFRRRETIWKYFIVDKNRKVDLVTNDLAIVDTGAGGGSPYDVYNFTRQGAEPHGTIRINGADTVVFSSSVPIPFYELPKLNLELRKTPSDQRIITSLPNPSHGGIIKDEAGSAASEIYVFI